MRIFGFRPALWPTLFTIPALVLLLSLGTWQVDRLFWKLDLIETVERGLTADPVPLPAGDFDPEAWNYRRVTVSGTFDHAHEFHVFAHSERGNFGYHVVAPLKRSDAPGHVLVSRGWVPADKKDPAMRPEGQVTGEVSITGIVRLSAPQGLFVPDNEPDRNLWYYADAAGMLAAAGIDDAPMLIVDAEASATVPGGWPRPGHTRVTFPNNHLAYAFTWYGGAIVLAAIYVIWHRRRERGGGTPASGQG
ncbi:MAG TPA: SURF1 family protein [Ferrovibrio sp.]|uniref:SURF1 family protein n=1 Tax=Ferrovibrio sp. TaxID=1917215 RepID=UPI002B4B87F9|nr:SURF1 family protein [Ferrovibrio sp.]HLT78850.1 SURF1 family protein [Ferrovibrio sp.]